MLKRFRKKVVKSGVLSTVRRKRWFVSKSEQRRMEKRKQFVVLSDERLQERLSKQEVYMAKEEDKIRAEGVVVEALPGT